MIKEFLVWRDKALYNSVVLSNRTSTGVFVYCTAVNWLLSTFSTDENINKEVGALQSIRQKLDENETEYFTRFVELHTTRGSYLQQSRLHYLFINGLDPRLRNSVRTFMTSHSDGDLGALLEAAEREGSTIRAILGSAPKRNLPAMPGTKPTALRKRTGSTVAIVAPPYEQDDPVTEEMFYSNKYSVPTEELPSTDQGSEMTPMDQQNE
eukprot:IDg3277t1